VNKIKTLATRRDDDEQGFTLIELMVVVLIIAILIAIAIPTFLGARQRAQDRAAQSNLRNGLTAEKTFYTDNQTYGTDALMTTSNIETSLKWGTAPSATVDVGVTVSADKLGVCLEAKSKSGTTFALMDLSSGSTAGTYYAKATCSTPPDSGGAVPAGFNPGGW
jgi:type IV pilus assembly protein PilA